MSSLSDHVEFLARSFSNALPEQGVDPEILMQATVKVCELLNTYKKIEEEELSFLTDAVLDVVQSIPEHLYLTKEELVSFFKDELTDKVSLNSSLRLI